MATVLLRRKYNKTKVISALFAPFCSLNGRLGPFRKLRYFFLTYSAAKSNLNSCSVPLQVLTLRSFLLVPNKVAKRFVRATFVARQQDLSAAV